MSGMCLHQTDLGGGAGARDWPGAGHRESWVVGAWGYTLFSILNVSDIFHNKKEKKKFCISMVTFHLRQI